MYVPSCIKAAQINITLGTTCNAWFEKENSETPLLL
jgi:hypothetical protein